MTTVISGSSPSITFSDSTTQTTAFTSTPSVTSITTSSDSTINTVVVGKGGGNDATSISVGSSTLSSGNTGTDNNAFGVGTLFANTTGSSNSGFGRAALRFNTTGSNNTAVGLNALISNTTASNNTAVGYQAGYSNTQANSNTFIGHQSGYSANLTSGSSYLTYVGQAAGYNTTTGIANTAMGQGAGFGLTTGSYNSFFGARSSAGYGAGELVTTGSKNTIIGGYNGNQGGLDIRTSSNYVVLSDGDGNPVGYYKGNNQTWVFGQGGTGSTGDGNIILNGAAPAAGNGAYIGGQSNGTGVWAIGSYRSVISGTNTWFTCQNSGGGGVYLNGASATSWTAVSDETRKVIIEPITDGLNKVSTLRTVIGRLKTDEESVRRPYLIAQDVQAVLPEAVSEAEDKEGAVLGLSYTEVIPLLVASIKELKTIVDAQAAEIAELKAKG